MNKLATSQTSQRCLAGRYGLGPKLASGGMGVVYSATDIRTQQPVAIKVLATDPAGKALPSWQRAVQRFKREFRTASRIAHRNCLPAYAMGEIPTGWFFSMALARGGNLRDASRDQRLEWPAVVGVGLQLLRGLDAIHSRDVVHRDLKPENVLLSEPLQTGHPLPTLWLSDFGIAKVGDQGDKESLGEVVGSFAYMAPEALEGEASDPRVDLYALGVMLYELLAGRHPLSASIDLSPTDWVRVHRDVRPDAQALQMPGVSAGLTEVILSLLQRDPGQRPRTAALAYDALLAFLPTDAPRDDAPLEGSPYMARPPLVGRTAELGVAGAALTTALRRPTATQPAIVTVHGDAGTGKSRFATALLRDVPSDTVLLFSTSRDGPTQPFGAFIALLDGLSRLQQQQGGDGRGTETGSSTVQMEGGAPEIEVEADTIVRALADRLIRVARSQPCLVVIEDGQWLDPQSLQGLQFLLHALAENGARSGPLRLGFLITHRPPGGDNRVEVLRGVLAAFERTDIALQPLDDSAIEALVAGLLMTEPTPALRSMVTALFAGQPSTPLFAVQLLRLLLTRGLLTRGNHDARGRWLGHWNFEVASLTEAPLPRTVQAAVGERAARLSTGTQQLLTAASVAGRRFNIRQVSVCLGMHRNQLLDCVDEAVQQGFVVRSADAVESTHGQAMVPRDGVLRESADPADNTSNNDEAYMFVHDRLREALYSALDEPSRLSWHRAHAQAITAVHGDAILWAAPLAYHHRRSLNFAEAAPHALRAARHAVAERAPFAAVEHFRDALADATAAAHPELMGLDDREAYADSCVRVGQYSLATTLYAECASAIAQAGLAAERAHDVRRKLAECNLQSGEFADAARPLEAIVADLGVPMPTQRVSYILHLLPNMVRTLLLAWAPHKRRRTPRSPEELVRLMWLAQAWQMLGEAYAYTHWQRAFYVAMAGGALGRRLGPSPQTASSLAGVSYMLGGALGLHRAAERCGLAALEEIDRQGPAEKAFAHAMYLGGRVFCGLETPVDHTVRAVQAAVEAGDLSRTSLCLVFAEANLRYGGRLNSARLVANALTYLGQRGNHEQIALYGAAFVEMATLALAGTQNPQIYADAIASARRRRDVLTELLMGGHLALAQAVASDGAMDLEAALETAEGFLRGRFMSAMGNPLSSLLAAIALHVQNHPIGPKLARRVHSTAQHIAPICRTQRQESALWRAAHVGLTGWRRGAAAAHKLRQAPAAPAAPNPQDVIAQRILARLTVLPEAMRAEHHAAAQLQGAQLALERPDSRLLSILQTL